MEFLPKDYEIPASGGGYTKLEKGKTKLRILSSPKLLWTKWEGGTCTRYPYAGKDSKPTLNKTSEKDSVKHSWAVICYNYVSKQIEIWEITQVGIMSTIKALTENPSWGQDLTTYDLVIEKKGDGLDTEYTLMPEPKTDPSTELIEAFNGTPIDLNQLLVKDGNPFIGSAPGKASGAASSTNTTKVVTPENWVPGDPIPDGYIVNPADTTKVKKKLPFG